ncbi:hypothetical protein [Labilithrix luteola]|nr:hypothetical protein [Labilithrix luteola]
MPMSTAEFSHRLARIARLLATAMCAGTLVACGNVDGVSSTEAPGTVGTASPDFASAVATLVDFAWSGELLSDTDDPGVVRQLIQTQVLYSVGILNGDLSVGRYERLDISDIRISPAAQGGYRVAYRASLPVAWGNGATPPSSYPMTFPVRVDASAQQQFTRRYGAKCVSSDGGDLSAATQGEVGVMFLFYRPSQEGCVLAPEDVTKTTATTRVSAENTVGKYPEYDLVWRDRALEVVAVFGFEANPTPQDAGQHAYEQFLDATTAFLTSLQPDASKRAFIRGTREDGAPLAVLEAELPSGLRVRVNTTRVGTWLDSEGPAFDAWYERVTPRADLVFYSGHSGQGGNVRALMNRGTFVSSQYLLWVVNGCDTLAYIDRTLADRRALLNPDDPSGTKYMDTVSNALGSWFREGDQTGMRLVQELVTGGLEPSRSKSYQEIFAGVDRDQIIVVTGEEDNVFQPETGAGPPSVPTPQDPPSREGTPAGPGALDPKVENSDDGGCATGRSSRSPADLGTAFAVIAVSVLLARRALRGEGRSICRAAPPAPATK